jgi:hypothetical protein
MHRTEPGWHVFVDHKDRFCFEYPPQYQVAPPKFGANVSHGLASEFLGRLTTKPSPALTAVSDDPKDATIGVFAYGTQFRPNAQDRDHAPEHIHAAHEEFYYYGRGGGGVDYPDSFYFGLRGQTSSSEFIGPYTQSNIPDADTKDIEPKVLASFRHF